ncbi:Basic-leucine zipper (bZIP) transcription factor [Metarhizium rileyi]|uniref:Basic-leucine zipper (BZIP) transcription factor n=1 Tax=Metarhizium rileyi (strain RCEF 4871) TaxID=1649241 RepID=A0A167AFC3_METRR|nr:Basic-leucine zipper (bZIP) transcription factor [Metarhizium rileyi RCEF 4871]TWU77329.1 hypothetical protein ED733_005259 [Metarhizium rileyi]
MSQREPTTRPTARTSPAISAETRNRTFRHSVGSHDTGSDVVKQLPKESTGQSHQVPPRSLGMLNILNPSYPRPRDSQIAHDLSTQTGQSSSTYSARLTSLPRQPGTGHSASASYPGTPVGNFNLGSISERQSPTMGYPFPNMNEPRKTLSPKAPRASSLSRSSGPREFEPRPHGYTPAVSPAKRPYNDGTTDEPRQLPTLHQTPGISHNTGRQVLTSPPRRLSQPVNRVAEAFHMQGQSGPSQDAQGLPPHHQFQLGQTPRQLPNASRPLEKTSWTEVMRRSGVSAVSGGIEGQQAFMTLPGSDTPIPVQVDYSQASRKADEKRQRNAKASTRHRRKKKTIQEENIRQLQELKDERQQMSEAIDQLRRERDFYRDERNRLRDVVSRTPSIHQHAVGPRSPTPARSVGSHTDHSPISQHLIPTSTQGYASDPASIDRASQRPKIDERTDFAGPALPPGVTPVGLATPYGHQYGIPPRPASAASSGSGDILPPLRAMEGPSSSTVQHIGPGQAHEQDPRTGQWRPVPPRQVETGWATGPRKPGEQQW